MEEATPTHTSLAICVISRKERKKKARRKRRRNEMKKYYKIQRG
jgi:hypothetical protein